MDPERTGIEGILGIVAACLIMGCTGSATALGDDGGDQPGSSDATGSVMGSEGGVGTQDGGPEANGGQEDAVGGSGGQTGGSGGQTGGSGGGLGADAFADSSPADTSPTFSCPGTIVGNICVWHHCPAGLDWTYDQAISECQKLAVGARLCSQTELQGAYDLGYTACCRGWTSGNCGQGRYASVANHGSCASCEHTTSCNQGIDSICRSDSYRYAAVCCKSVSSGTKNLGTSCSNAGECSSGYCTNNVCCTKACAANETCDSSGTCKRNLGASCTDVGSAGCLSGTCVDQTCCTSVCGICSRCNVNGQGTCAPAPQYDGGWFGTSASPSFCNGQCDGSGSCKKINGTCCASASECASGKCVLGNTSQSCSSHMWCKA